MDARTNLNRFVYFIAVAEAGTITAAAERLKVSKAVVSKQLQMLESDLSVSLVVRNPRHLHLTEAGQQLYEQCRPAIRQIDDATAAIRDRSAEPSGHLRVTAPLDIGSNIIAPCVAEFTSSYARVTVDLVLSDSRYDPVEAQFDVAFRAGWLKDSSNKARKLGESAQRLLAAPRLFDRFDRPATLEELAALPFVMHRGLPHGGRWMFANGEGAKQEVVLHPALSTDTTPALLALTVGGAGIAILPDFVSREALADGSLVELIPEWWLEPVGIYAVYPPASFRSAAARELTRRIATRLSAFLDA